jgi:hypothetical protein
MSLWQSVGSLKKTLYDDDRSMGDVGSGMIMRGGGGEDRGELHHSYAVRRVQGIARRKHVG